MNALIALDEQKPRLILGILFLLAGLLALGVVFSVQRMKEPRATVTPRADLGPAPVFLLTDQDGNPFRSSDLAGEVWIADFFFTRCRTLCPRLTEKMLVVQEALRGRTGYRLLSLSVDPENDSPEALRAYAGEHGANLEVWTFLTGDKAYIHDLIRKGFLSPVTEEGGTPDMPILHSSRFALVDRTGRFRGFFDALDDDQVEALIREAVALLDAPAS